jgi:ankyrin repeat protein
VAGGHSSFLQLGGTVDGVAASSELPKSSRLSDISRISKLRRERPHPKIPKRRNQLFNSLRFEHIEDRYNNIKPAHSETCQWLLTNKKYQAWLDKAQTSDRHKFLWLKGKPGAGKSTIMKFTLAEAKRSRAKDIHISFFFNARGSSLEKTTLGMYRSLLFQLLEQFPEAMEVFDEFGILQLPQPPQGSWTIPQLQLVLRYALQELGERWLWIFVDALDECDEDQVREMVSFLNPIGPNTITSGLNMSVFFASRHYPRITTSAVQLNLEDEEEHSRDIQRYIESELRTGNSMRSITLENEVKRRSSGVFIWVVLVVQILNKAADHGIVPLEQKLQEIPNNLSELFTGILARDPQNTKGTLLCIQWILFAARPLSRVELYFGIRSGTHPEEVGSWDSAEVATEVIDAFILSCSKGLAEVTQSSTVQFIHETIRDFLLKGNGMRYIQESSSQPVQGFGHSSLSQCCANCILSTRRFLRQERLPTLPLIKYALWHIFYHADAAESYSVSQASFLRDFDVRQWIDLTQVFQIEQKYVPPWMDLLQVSQIEKKSYPLNSTFLQIFAEQNLKSLIEAMLRLDPQIDIDEGRSGSPLRIALKRRNCDALGALLTPDCVLRPPDYDDDSAHYPASLQHRSNQSELMSLTDIFSFIQTKVTSAASIVYLFFLYATESDVITLIRSGRFNVDANLSAEKSCSPLSVAAERGYESLVAFLLNKQDITIDHQDYLGLTPLSKAAREGRLNIAQLLLNGTRKANVNLQSFTGRSPLSYSAEEGNENVLRLLLAQPTVKLNLRDEKGRTPFFHAAKCGRNGIIEVLMGTPGVDIVSRDNFGQTALSYAVLGGHEGVVRQLLDTGKVDVNSQDNQHARTPLSMALEFNHQSIAKLLLHQPDIDLNIRVKGGISSDYKDGKYGLAPLSWAALNGKDEVVKLLLSKPNVDPDLKDAKDGRTPLSWAAVNGCDTVVRELLATGRVNPNSEDTEYGRTPLWWAAEQGHNAVVNLLLEEQDVDPDATDKQGQTPVAIAARNGHGAVVELLANKGVNLELEDDFGRTPLWWAIQNGHQSIVQMLLKYGCA